VCTSQRVLTQTEKALMSVDARFMGPTPRMPSTVVDMSWYGNDSAWDMHSTSAHTFILQLRSE
jgi:hypothetical protein